jgi:hypothetical protein
MEKIELTKEQVKYIGTWLNDYEEKRFGESAEDYVWEEMEYFEITHDYIDLVKYAVEAYNGGAR